MHIGFITTEYPHKTNQDFVGGIGTFTKNIAEELIKKKIKVSVFLASQNRHDIFNENGVTIHQVPSKIFKGFTWLSNRLYFNKYVNTIVEKEGIDILEAPEWTGFTAFMTFRKPLVLRLHGSDTYFCSLENRKVKSKNKFFEKEALKRADKIVGVSSFVAFKTKQLFNIKKEIPVIYNTINIEDFKPDHSHVQPKTLLYFGTIIRKKGVLEIAKMFNIVVEKDIECKLVFLGRDTIDVQEDLSTLQLFKNQLSTKAREKFTHIHPVAYSKVKSYLNTAEVVLLPSFAEAFPMTWLEAMALEKKLVTSDIGWSKELMINGETGYTINPKSHAVFAEKVLDLINKNERAKQMAIEARNRIKTNFNYQDVLQENINLYKSLIVK